MRISQLFSSGEGYLCLGAAPGRERRLRIVRGCSSGGYGRDTRAQAYLTHPLRKGEIDVELPSAERLLRLARRAREILDEHGLRADLAETMCLPCTGCDITPHRCLT